MLNNKHITIMIKMFTMMKKMIIAVAMLLYSLFCTAQNLRGNMDSSVKPGDDFWQYAVGGWLKANPLDAQHPENGRSPTCTN
jgi:putative endopeptidase